MNKRGISFGLYGADHFLVPNDSIGQFAVLDTSVPSVGFGSGFCRWKFDFKGPLCADQTGKKY